MAAQRLPLRIAGGEPVRGYRRLWRARPQRPRPRALLATLGLAAAVGGAYLSSQPPPYMVSVDGSGYVVAGRQLAGRGDGVYGGAAGALVLRHRAGAIVAGASTTLRGVPASGLCLLPDGAFGEQCEFRVGDSRLKAVDQRSWFGWSRRYDDGRRVDIWVRSGGSVPVPFPLGA